MDKADRIYRGLQQHLDRQAVGYPATRTGAEIRILKRLFSPEEAELALHLTYKPMSVERTHESAKGSGCPSNGSRRCLRTWRGTESSGSSRGKVRAASTPCRSSSGCSRGN